MKTLDAVNAIEHAMQSWRIGSEDYFIVIAPEKWDGFVRRAQMDIPYTEMVMPPYDRVVIIDGVRFRRGE